MFYMFEVKIPVDAYPVFGLKRRSFLFVIDTRRSQAERLATFLRLYSLIAGFERVGSRGADPYGVALFEFVF